MTLSIIEHSDLGSVRTQMIKGEPYFCANDVCAILGYKNERDAIKKHCLERGITKCYTLTNGGNQGLNFINEGNPLLRKRPCSNIYTMCATILWHCPRRWRL